MLVSLDDLSARLPFVMDEDEIREANGALADLSFDAQTIGSANWTTPLDTPQSVKNLIVRAAARHMKNYEGYTMSRAGDETVQWQDHDVAGQATFTKDEKSMLKQMGGKVPFIGGVGVYAYGKRPINPTGWAPVDYALNERRSDFPMWADAEGLW